MTKYIKYRIWRRIIKKSDLFDEKYYLSMYSSVRMSDMDPIMHYIIRGADDGLNPSALFCTSYYLNTNEDVRKSNQNPLVHYIRFGKKEGRYCSNRQTEKENTGSILKHEIGGKNDDLRRVIGLISEYLNGSFEQKDLDSMEKIIKFIKTIDTSTISIDSVFDAELYVTLYRDLKTKKINPLLHYLLHGLKEGRTAYLNRNLYIKKGGNVFSKEKKTIVFVTHESSATGAPLLGFSIVEELSKKYNVIHIIMHKKNDSLHQKMIENSYLTIDNIEGNPYLYAKFLMKSQALLTKIECVVCNSVVCRPVLQAAYELKFPTLTLVHEFSDYTRPLGSMRKIIEYSTHIIVPATIIKDSIYDDVLVTSSAKNLQPKPNNIHVLPQGKLPFIPDSNSDNYSVEQLKKIIGIDNNDEYKIIVASGWVQIRKGVDLFVATAKKIKQKYYKKCKFVWVGEGYDPINDFAFSIWLQRELKYSGLEEDFIFLKHQQNLDNIFSIADLFCLTSRMDPFPNVVVDALSFDLPIACFEHTTGSSEFLQKSGAVCYIAQHLDTYDLAYGVIRLLDQEKIKNGVNKEIVEKQLNFHDYVVNLEDLMKKSIKDQMQYIKESSLLEKSLQLEADYYLIDDNCSYYDKCYRYVGNTLKELYDYNPRPGFSQLKWILDRSNQKQHKELLVELKNGVNTHNIVTVPSKSDIENFNGLYAIHLHLYYVELAEEFVAYFKKLPYTYDLFITVINQNEEKIKKLFVNSGARNIYVKNTKNIGRDYAPMLFEIGNDILAGGYSIIGHFHSKKSADINDDSGDRWREFLLETLIGDEKVSKSIIDMFHDETLGLVFPDDRHCVDVGENRKYLHELCDMLSLPKVDETPLFPIGNMFWVRTSAIRELFSLSKEEILQEEPLPYDGSYMHALERVTPILVKSKNYKQVTVYRKGYQW